MDVQDDYATFNVRESECDDEENIDVRYLDVSGVNSDMKRSPSLHPCPFASQ